MVRIFLSLGLILFCGIAYGQEQQSIDHKINEWVSPATDFISAIIFYSVPVTDKVQVPLILFWLLVAGSFFTVYLGFPNFRYFRHAIDVTRGAYDDPDSKGEVSHFQALSAALSGTLGLGNIAGVALAIGFGGPGATVWMIFAGLIGMSSKFAECTLGVKYRNISPSGEVSGGPMYYLSKTFERIGFPGTGKALAVFFSVLCVGGSIGGGNMFQSNQSTRQIINVLNVPMLTDNAWIVGLITAILVGVVIIGGIKSIGKAAELLVPFMCGIYILACIVVLGFHYHQIPQALATIFTEAFKPDALYGGIIGVMLQGFKRASFSNEAGIGSASIAHSAVKTQEPVSEGMVGLLEPFIDTVLVCTMTALVITITGVYKIEGVDGIELTSRALESSVSWFPYLLVAIVFLFAYCTMISWSYYGLKSWTYLFGHGVFSRYSFKFLFCFCTTIGASMNLSSVVDFSDAMIFAMSIPNIIGLYFLAPEVKKDLGNYVNRWKAGKIKKYK